MQLSKEEQNALENVNVKALQTAFQLVTRTYSLSKPQELYMFNPIFDKDPTGLARPLCLLPSMLLTMGHGLFRWGKKVIRTHGYESALARFPSPDNAKQILHDFLLKSSKGTEIDSLKSLLLSTYLHLATTDAEKVRISRGYLINEAHDAMDDNVSASRIKDAIAVLEGNNNNLVLEDKSPMFAI